MELPPDSWQPAGACLPVPLLEAEAGTHQACVSDLQAFLPTLLPPMRALRVQPFGLGAGQVSGRQEEGPLRAPVAEVPPWWAPLQAFSLVPPACKADSPLPGAAGRKWPFTPACGSACPQSFAAVFTQGQASRCPEQTDARPVQSP